MTGSTPTNQKSVFWRDERFLQVLGQVVFVILAFLALYYLFRNMVTGLQKQGMTVGLNFLKLTSGFDLGESLIEYSRNSSYLRAFQVGVLNTLLVGILGIGFSTFLGIIVGVARLSTNFIINRISRVYIEFIRNIPLLVLLVFWYNAVFLKLPRIRDAISLPGSIFLTNRGVGIPWGTPTSSFKPYLYILGIGLASGIGLAVWLYRRGQRTGRMPLGWLWGLILFVIVAVPSLFMLSPAPLDITKPYIKGLNLDGGLILSPEFMAILSGLIFYTAAFIGEVVRSGIQSVSKGQIEAARSIGLNSFQTLRLVVFPQAMRVIVPPLTSQYLNLTKNSSLAVAIAYPDVFYVSNTILNQSGRAVEMMALVMLTYLIFSLLTSLFMNWYNRKIRLVER